jgi:hypothetical protein
MSRARYPASRKNLASARAAVKDALNALDGVGEALLELIRTRQPNTCAMCGRKAKRVVCARADCATEYERLYQADRRERRRALRGTR